MEGGIEFQMTSLWEANQITKKNKKLSQVCTLLSGGLLFLWSASVKHLVQNMTSAAAPARPERRNSHKYSALQNERNEQEIMGHPVSNRAFSRLQLAYKGPKFGWIQWLPWNFSFIYQFPVCSLDPLPAHWNLRQKLKSLKFSLSFHTDEPQSVIWDIKEATAVKTH